MEHLPVSILCPHCGRSISLDPASAATDWDEFDGCIGPMLEYRFEDVPLTCPGCQAHLSLSGTLSNSMGQLTNTLRVTPQP